MIKAVLFDLDGTLVDSKRAIVHSVNELLDGLGLPKPDPAEITGLIGVGLKPLLERFIPDPSPHIEEYRRLYRRNFGALSALYEGAAETLAGLRGKGVKTGVLTNRSTALATTIVEHFGLDKHLDELVGDGEGFPLKPDPATFFEACRRLGLEPAAAAMAGDTEIDVSTGKNAGAVTVLVVHPDSIAGAPDKIGADYIVYHLIDILNVMDKENG